MKQMSLIEMDGFLKGKCIPRDLKVNETNAEYLVRKFGELESKLETALRECRSAGITIDNLEARCAALAAENAALKSNLIFWDAEDPETPYDTPEEVAEACTLDYNDEFIVQVANRLPNRTYRVCESWEHECKIELVEGGEVKTPSTDAFLAEVRAQGVEAFANSLKVAGGHEHPYSEVANEFAAQIRKGGNQ